MTSSAPVTALQALAGRLLWPGLPCTTTVTSTRPRLPRLIRLPVPLRTAISARAPVASMMLLMASWRPVSPDTQHRNRTWPDIGTRPRRWIEAPTGSQRAAPSVRSSPCRAPPRPAGRTARRRAPRRRRDWAWSRRGWVIALVTSMSERPLSPRPKSRQQIAHAVAADIGQSHFAEPRLDGNVDELAELRFRLELFGQRARHAHELDHQSLGVLCRDQRQVTELRSAGMAAVTPWRRCRHRRQQASPG